VELACKQMKGSFYYCEFASGVKCLKNTKMMAKMDQVCMQVLAEKGCVSSSDLPKILKSVSLLLAREWLLEQEQAEVLVRDVDSYGNILWYKNLFRGT
jgi:hypothetical protein